jgi:hypothetical protein
MGALIPVAIRYGIPLAASGVGYLIHFLQTKLSKKKAAKNAPVSSKD